MKFLPSLAAALVLAAPAHAAVSILIEPSLSGGTVFTITQTSPNPILGIGGLSGYVLGMDLPVSIFNIPGSGSSAISGTFPTVLGTVTEDFTHQSFQLTGLFIGGGGTAPYALLTFAPIYLTSGQPSARFDVTQAVPVETSISPDALAAGTHSVNSLLFGTVTVTVIPEPSASAIFTLASLPLFRRRRIP